MPNIILLAPKNKFEFQDMIDFAINKTKSPIAIRYPRGDACDLLSNLNNPIILNTCELIYKGELILLISLGSMLELSLKIYNSLIQINLKPTLINPRFIKPTLDSNLITQILNHKYIFILEEHINSSGYSQNLITLLTQNNLTQNKFIHSFNLPSNQIISQGSRSQIFKSLNLDHDSILKKILYILNLN
jgi:1-deoxy-D-xylulose-5-phosphate synthase